LTPEKEKGAEEINTTREEEGGKTEAKNERA